MIRPVLQRALAALATSAAVTFAVLVANDIAYFIAQKMLLEVVARATVFYAPALGFLFVLIWVAAFLPLMSTRWLALASGVVAAVVSGLLGVGLQVQAQSPGYLAFWSEAIAGLVDLCLIFFVAAVIATATLGVWVNTSLRKILSRRRAKIALVRAPASTLSQGLVTHITRRRVNLDKADEQWDSYVDALQECGWRIVEVTPNDNLPDSVFVEDTVVVLGDTAIITSPGADERREETADTEVAVRTLGLRIAHIHEPGRLDGGDVLVVGDMIYVGRSTRSNDEGLRQLRALTRSLGFTVVAVPVGKALHLKSAVSALPDGTIIGFAQALPDTSVFSRFLAVPEALGATVVIVDHHSVLISASAPKTADLLRSLGYRVIAVEMTEFEKLEGSVTCLSVLLR